MTAKVLAEAAIRKVKGVLDKFWRGVASMMGWKYISIRSKKKAVKIGAIKVDGNEYCVKTTMLEYKQSDRDSREYAYDVTKIEVLDDTAPNTSVDLDRATKGLLPLAKIIKKLKKSYDSGKKILLESEKADKKLLKQDGNSE